MGKMKFLVSSRNIKPWSRTKPIGRSTLYGQIMAENSPRNNSRNYVENIGLRGIWNSIQSSKEWGYGTK